MKRLLVIASVLSLSALGIWGCGSDEATTDSEAPNGPFGTITEGGGRTEPEIDPSDGPPPKKTFVRDIEVGSGPVARRGDTVAVYYLGVNYNSGGTDLFRWAPEKPWEQQIHAGTAWEENIEGMRVGGRREILVPSRLALGNGAIDYLVELLDVKSSS
jgi:peptidylprolyl isomerase